MAIFVIKWPESIIVYTSPVCVRDIRFSNSSATIMESMKISFFIPIVRIHTLEKSHSSLGKRVPTSYVKFRPENWKNIYYPFK